MKSLMNILREIDPRYKRNSWNKYGGYNSDVKLRSNQSIIKDLIKASRGIKWAYDYNKNIFTSQGHSTNKEFKIGLPLKNNGYWVISTYENGDYRDASKTKQYDHMLKILNRIVK